MLKNIETKNKKDIQFPSRDNIIPVPPFYGKKIITDVDITEVYSWINERSLFRARWEYKQKNKSDADYQKLLKDVVIPEFNFWKQKVINENLFQPTIIYGYWKCRSQNNQVILFDQKGNEKTRLTYPRQTLSPFRCIADYFHPDNDDVIALLLVSIGHKFVDFEKELYNNNEYKDYFLLHGFGVELTERMAEYYHKIIRKELGISSSDGKTKKDILKQKYQGRRYSFGYPPCPDLEQNKIILDILEAGKYGVSITDSFLMIPEQTTSSVICHHPEAEYFTI